MRCPLLNTLFVFGRQAFAFSDDSSFFCPYFKRKEQMATEHVLEDKELGRLLVRVNVRARRLTFRTREDAIYVTVPPGTTIGEVKNAVEQLRPRLKAARQQQSRPLIDLDYRIDTEFFKLSLVGGERDRFFSRSELGGNADYLSAGCRLLK